MQRLLMATTSFSADMHNISISNCPAAAEVVAVSSWSGRQPASQEKKPVRLATTNTHHRHLGSQSEMKRWKEPG